MTISTAEDAGWSGRRWRMVVWVTLTGLILLLPLIAMRFTDEVDWNIADFVVIGALLIGVGAAYELVATRSRITAYRAAVAVGLAGALALVWVNGAVGIIGAEDNDANLMYGAVLAVGAFGAMVARLRPGGMARAMLAMALTQVPVAVIALSAGVGSPAPDWQWDLLALTGFFAALWLMSAWLFRMAALKQAPETRAA